MTKLEPGTPVTVISLGSNYPRKATVVRYETNQVGDEVICCIDDEDQTEALYFPQWVQPI